MGEVRIFVGHSFRASRSRRTIDGYRRVVKAAIHAAQLTCERRSLRFTFRPFFASTDYGDRLPGVVRDALNASAIGIVDLTELRPNVLFESGFLLGGGRPCLVVMRHGTDLPADLRDVLVGVYKNDGELRQMIAARLADIAGELVTQGRGIRGGGGCEWFPKPPSTVSIVCAPESERSRFAFRTEANYLFLDNLEDRDALFEVATFLSRTYPSARLDRYSSNTVIGEALGGDLVVIGGPGEPGGAGNEVCRDVLRSVGASISYTDECDAATYRGRRHVPKLGPSGTVDVDVGYFLRATNPYNVDRNVVVLSGVYTAGTLGAALAFSDHPLARANVAALRRVLGHDERRRVSFEALFPVEVHVGGVVRCPEVPASAIRRLRRKRGR